MSLRQRKLCASWGRTAAGGHNPTSGCMRLWSSAAGSAASASALIPRHLVAGCMQHSKSVQARQLTAHIRSSSSLADLAAACYLGQLQFNPIHVSAALRACVRLQQQQQHHHCQQQHCAPLLPAVVQARQRMQPYRLHRLHKQQLQHNALCRKSAQQLHEIAVWVLQRLTAQEHLCTAREAACILWCCAKLRHMPPAGVLTQLLARLADVAHAGSCQALSMALYSLVLLQHVPHEAVLHQLLHSLIKAAAPAMDSTPSEVEDSAAAQRQSHTHCDHQHQHRPNEQQQQQQQQQPLCSLQASSSAIWALVRLHQPAVATVWLLPLLSVLQSSLSLTAAGTSEQHQQQPQQQPLVPNISVLGGQAAELRAASVTQAVANALWASAVLLQADRASAGGHVAAREHSISQQERRQQQLLPAVRQAAAQLLDSCAGCLWVAQPRELVMTLWACSKLRLQPNRGFLGQLWGAHSGVARMSGSEAATALHAVARLKLCPPPAWVAALLAASQRQLGSLSCMQLSVMVWACGALRCRPPRGWMHAALAQLEVQLQVDQAMRAACLGSVVWSLSKLGFQPPQSTAHALMAVTESFTQELGPHQLSKLLMGYSRLHWTVPAALLTSFQAQLQQASPTDVTMALRAAAMCQRSAPATQQAEPQQLLLGAQQHVLGGTHGLEGWTQGHRPLAAGLARKHSSAGGMVRGAAGDQVLHNSWWQHQPGEAWSAVLHNSKLLQCVPSTPLVSVCLAPSSERDSTTGSQLVQLLFLRAEQLLWAMTAAELCQCLWSAAQLQARLSLQWGQAVNHTLLAQMHQLGPGDLCLLLWAVARLQGGSGWRLKRRLHWQLLVHSQQLMAAGRCTPRDLSAFLWNYTRVFCAGASRDLTQQCLPQLWLATFFRAVRATLHNFTGRQLGVLLRACVLLDILVDELLLSQAATLLELHSTQLSKGELGTIRSSLLQLQQRRCTAAAATAAASASVRSRPGLWKARQQPVLGCRSAATPSTHVMRRTQMQLDDVVVLETSLAC